MTLLFSIPENLEDEYSVRNIPIMPVPKFYDISKSRFRLFKSVSELRATLVSFGLILKCNKTACYYYYRFPSHRKLVKTVTENGKKTKFYQHKLTKAVFRHVYELRYSKCGNKVAFAGVFNKCCDDLVDSEVIGYKETSKTEKIVKVKGLGKLTK